METIFHEKQEGSLCAQHCLNALLQNQYFSAVDLAQIGQRLDERERDRMAEGGIGTSEYRRFIEEPSSNFDDSGFFSVQVITEALSVWGLDIVLFNSQDPIAVQAREDPTQMSAFICNYLQHWFCIRKLGRQWFNLNSLLSGPELISNTYLSLFLTQLQQEGYSIFIVVGNLPECEADQLLRLVPAVQNVKPRLLNEKETENVEGTDVDEEDRALKEALRVSKELIDNDDTALQKALQLSMEEFTSYLELKYVEVFADAICK
ncbi:Ataxin-3 [Bulinus truncatus]|nr:Ataxin-3 [Bulinus truncatus]